MPLTTPTQETGPQMSDATSTSADPRAEDDGARAAYVRDAATEHASKHARVIRSAKDGRALSAVMLPFFELRPPSGYGVITTTGRKTGKVRRKCVRVIRRGNKAYIVQLRPPKLAARAPVGRGGVGLEHKRRPGRAAANPRRYVRRRSHAS